MTKTTLILALTSIIAIAGYAQEKAPQLHNKMFSYEIENRLKAEKLSKSSAAYQYTYIGDYKKAIESYSLLLDWGLDSMDTDDSLYFATFQSHNAFEYLEEKTKDEDVVIISEAHQMPQHRIFTKDLLPILYKNGFRHIGLETLTPSYGDSTKFLMDTNLQERKYPLNSPLTGHYTREPQMGNLVREALRLGFQIFGYERTDRKTERDLQQAKNIERYTAAHPGEKIVIHCGWYHAIESDYPKRKSDNYMAYHLKSSTGVDPLTIYQDALSERGVGEESPYYKGINANDVSVLLDGNGKVFNGVDDQTHFDILIYHTRTRYIKNRPHWLAKSGNSNFVAIEKERVLNASYPIIVEAFPLNEKYSVPADVVELKAESDETELILPTGKYMVRLTNSEDNVVEYTVDLKH